MSLAALLAWIAVWLVILAAVLWLTRDDRHDDQR